MNMLLEVPKTPEQTFSKVVAYHWKNGNPVHKWVCDSCGKTVPASKKIIHSHEQEWVEPTSNLFINNVFIWSFTRNITLQSFTLMLIDLVYNGTLMLPFKLASRDTSGGVYMIFKNFTALQNLPNSANYDGEFNGSFWDVWISTYTLTENEQRLHEQQMIWRWEFGAGSEIINIKEVDTELFYIPPNPSPNPCLFNILLWNCDPDSVTPIWKDIVEKLKIVKGNFPKTHISKLNKELEHLNVQIVTLKKTRDNFQKSIKPKNGFTDILVYIHENHYCQIKGELKKSVNCLINAFECWKIEIEEETEFDIQKCDTKYTKLPSQFKTVEDGEVWESDEEPEKIETIVNLTFEQSAKRCFKNVWVYDFETVVDNDHLAPFACGWMELTDKCERSYVVTAYAKTVEEILSGKVAEHFLDDVFISLEK